MVSDETNAAPAEGAGARAGAVQSIALSDKAIRAQEYLRLGFAVVPLGSEHGPRPKLVHAMAGSGWSFSERQPRPFIGLRDPQVAAEFWTRFPEANLGIVTGMPSRLLVIDCDRHFAVPQSVSGSTVSWGDLMSSEDGVTNFHTWAADSGVDLSTVPCAETATGRGLHYFWRVEQPVRSGAWLPGVDVKADGGFVVAAPSRVNGVEYRWLTRLDGLAMAPSSLLAALHVRRGQSISGHAAGASEMLPPTAWFLAHGFGGFTGSRDQDCYRLVFRLLNGPEDEMWATLYRTWIATPPKDHPFTWDDVTRKVESARRRWQRNPVWPGGGVL